MKKFTVVFFAAVALFLSVLGGAVWAGNEAPKSISVVDVAGRTVTVRQPVNRVVLTFNFEEYVAVTGEKGLDKIAGWSTRYWKGRRQSTWDAFAEKFPSIEGISDVGYIRKSTFNVEAVVALKPDVVFMAENDIKLVGDELALLEKVGIPVVFVDYHSQTLDNHVKSTMLFGEIMGETDRASDLVDYYRKNFDLVRDRLAKVSGPRPKVYMEFSGDKSGPAVFGPTWGKKMWGGIVENCRGDNVARDLIFGASGNVSPEEVLASDPDVIILAGNYIGDSAKNVGLGYGADRAKAMSNLRGYCERPGWNDISAVRAKRIGALYHDLSRHIFDVAGMQFIAKMLYPDVFSDVNPDETLNEFYRRFFPIEPAGTFMIKLDE